MSGCLGRYAPSPTGDQHLGNLLIAILAWGWARRQGGACALRIDDLDGPRVKAGSEESILEDLAWLGLDFSPMPDEQLGCRQSDRSARYRALHEGLLKAEQSYPSPLSRKAWAEALSAPHGEGLALARRRSAEAVEADGDQSLAYRFRASDELQHYLDGNLGPQQSEVDDFVLWRRDGLASYHLACVVDDHDLGVTQVLRGADLVSSTFRQLALYRALGWTPPEHLHLPLVVTEAGERLEKRHGLPGLRALRQRGMKPASLFDWALQALGGEAGRALDAHSFAQALPDPPWPRGPFILPRHLR